MSRYSVEFSKTLDKRLSEFEKDEDKDRYEIIESALKTYLYLKNQTTNEGYTVSLTKDGKIIKNVIIP